MVYVEYEVSVGTEINRVTMLSENINERGLRTYGDKPNATGNAQLEQPRSPYLRR
ncbi:conserved hypothetical protein [Xenorhabdus nematophila str. Anatoliense]|nr:conserved hypothetical protein [Xenorhabdus nematophila str. Anatoliense]CEE93404.1 conserved hypothetical protein [Xenorhabdus nematophila str. Anatoliense]